MNGADEAFFGQVKRHMANEMDYYYGRHTYVLIPDVGNLIAPVSVLSGKRILIILRGHRKMGVYLHQSGKIDNPNSVGCLKPNTLIHRLLICLLYKKLGRVF